MEVRITLKHDNYNTFPSDELILRSGRGGEVVLELDGCYNMDGEYAPRKISVDRAQMLRAIHAVCEDE